MAYGETYDEFVEKFKPKRTTDDCLTPAHIYNAVKSFVVDRYRLHGRRIVRPFWPGGDFEGYDYKPGEDVVIDNPPFSILSHIVRWYQAHGIDFFLFAPAITLFNIAKGCPDICYIPTVADLIYENGANVKTSFITSLEPPDIIVKNYPGLRHLIDTAIAESKPAGPPKYSYPPEIVRALEIGAMAGAGISYELKRYECIQITRLKSQVKDGKQIFGTGFLLTHKATVRTEKARQDYANRQRPTKTPDYIWPLSDGERELISLLEEEEGNADPNSIN